MYLQGDILIVPFPFSDLSSIKQRPVLVLSKNIDNETSNDILTCGITSNIKEAKYSVPISSQNLVAGGIPVQSRIKVDKMFTLDQQIVRKRIGKLNDILFNDVRNEFFSLI